MATQPTETNTAEARHIDSGTGYGRPAPVHNSRLTEVGPGTPMGELMRRYWQPLGPVDRATTTPRRVKVLGENLILFRDKSGRPGLVAENCRHRNTSLFFGRVEDDGIRCCYHGWKFDVEGNCLERPCEPGRGRGLANTRQPWYPLQERYGVLWTYMGPPERKPSLPRWEALEPLEEGEFHEVSMYPGYGPGEILDYNWLQSWENAVDPVHAQWLHYAHSGNQFGIDPGVTPEEYDPSQLFASIGWQETRWGGSYHNTFPSPDSPTALLRYQVENILPNAFSVPNYVKPTPGVRNDQIGWMVPVDDTHHMIIQIARVTNPGDLINRVELHGGRPWSELTPAELQVIPGDYEAQATQGEISPHNTETLTMTDRGVALVRRLLERELAKVAAGQDPLGVTFDENEPPRPTSGTLTFVSGD